MSIGIGWFGLAFVIICLLFAILTKTWRRRFQEPGILVSTPFVEKLPKSGRSLIASLPYVLKLMALLFFLFAFLDIHQFIPRSGAEMVLPEPHEGLAIYLVVDQSSSMGQQAGTGGSSKLDVLKNMGIDFVKSRPEDMIGLVEFARVAQVVEPLTLDHAAVIKRLSSMRVKTDPSENGTAIGYAIYKTTELIAATRSYSEAFSDEGLPPYTIEGAAIIVVTDGIQQTHIEDQKAQFRSIDVPEATTFAKEQGVRVYFVVIEPRLAQEEFAPHRRQMQSSAEKTGGRLYLVDEHFNLQPIFASINTIEKGKIREVEGNDKKNMPEVYYKYSYSPFFMLAGLLSFALGLLLEMTLLRRIP